MIKPNLVFIAVFLSALLALSGTAHGDCTPDDGNNNRKNATPMEYIERVRGVVCPDDPYDFYVLRIAEGDRVSGSISFSSYQASTVLNIGRAESRKMFVENRATTEDNLQFTIDVPAGKLPPGTYYARISFESGADYDHEYMLGIDLTILTRAELDDKFVTGKSPEFKTTNKFAFLRVQPWPMYRGDARRNGRSYFQGPMAVSKVEMVKDLYEKCAPKPLPAGNPSVRRIIFQGLLVRSSDYIYCIAYHKDIEKSGYHTANYWGYHRVSYNLSSGITSNHAENYSMETCLDFQGNNYQVHCDTMAKCDYTANKDMLLDWTKIPYHDTIGYFDGYRYLTNLLGTRLYLHRGIIDGPFYITAFELGTGVAWHSKKFDNPMIGMMEDLFGNFYVTVIGEGLYKVGPNGEVQWNVLGQPQMQKPFGLAPADKSGRFGPICGNDGRIWVYTRSLASPPMEYHVFNTDGSEYKSGNFGAHINPLVCCCGHDGRFYVATNAIDVRCYNDWSELVWSTGLLPQNSMINTAITIQDMVMDSKNMIYVLKKTCGPNAYDVSLEVFAINPNGQIVSNTTINLPVGAGSENELAIGDNKKLVLLNSGGFLYVISALQIDADTIKSKIQLEGRED